MTAKFDEKKTGGPAFPIVLAGIGTDPGMTLRDYFAAAAMQGYIAAGTPSDVTYRDLAEKAYRAADAMLEERQT